MNFLISLFRLPFGLAATVIVSAFWLALWPLEILLGGLCLPFCCILLSRYDIKNTYGRWPFNCLKSLEQGVSTVWYWVRHD